MAATSVPRSTLVFHPDRATVRPSWSSTAAVLLATHLALTALRSFFPHAYGSYERSGTTGAAIVVVAVALAPLLAPLLRRVLAGRALPTVLVLLGAWRIAAQLWHGVPLPLAAAGAGVAGTALTLAVASADTGHARSTGLFGGLLLDAVVMGAFTTWDPVWQRGPLPMALAVALGAACVVTARALTWGAPPTVTDPELTVGAGIAVGAVLCLEVLFLANVGFVASASGASLSWATAFAMAGAATAAAAHTLARRPGAVTIALAGTGLAVVAWLLPVARGPAVVGLVLAGQTAVGLVASRALAPGHEAEHRSVAGELGLAIGWSFPVLATLLFQLHYDRALPVSNRLLTAAVGAAATLSLTRGRGALRTSPESPRPRLLPVTLAGALLAAAFLAGVLGTTAPATPSAAASPATTLRVVQWNVHQAVDEDGRLDPRAIERAIEALAPVDVVVLNEVGRGWPLSGQLDLASWLSRRLALPFVWGGAASGSFGNLVLSRLPVTASELVTLPSVPGTQGRSLLDLTLDRGAGSTVHLLATHLQHRNDPQAMQRRLDELAIAVQRTGDGPTVLAGDLNPKQGDPPAYPERQPAQFTEVRALLDAGYTTAADLTSCATPTSGRNCSDYVFVRGAAHQDRLQVVPAPLHDHRMVVTDISFR